MSVYGDRCRGDWPRYGDPRDTRGRNRYEDQSSYQAGPSHQPYRQENRAYPSHQTYPVESWEQLQVQHPYQQRPSSSNQQYGSQEDWRRRQPENVRTQPGHDHFYGDHTDRDVWTDRGDRRERYEQREYRIQRDGNNGYHFDQQNRSYVPASRSYSTQSAAPRAEYHNVSRSTPAARQTNAGTADRRVPEMSRGHSSSSYLPPQLRGRSEPTAESYPTATTYKQAAQTMPSSPTLPARKARPVNDPPAKQKGKKDFVITLPAPEYIALSDPSSDTSLAVDTSTKLLVLDLNGALVYRDHRSGERRRSFPRPYLAAFLEYLFLPDITPEGAEVGPSRPWEVFVWSSAQPHNVRAMVEGCFGEVFVEGVWEEEADEHRVERESRGEGRLIGVWSRDQLGLSSHNYHQKVQTVKDLRKLSAHLSSTLPNSTSDKLRPLSFDESNIVLLDDSPLKGIHQPWNEIILPEYEKEQYQASKNAVLRSDGDEGVPNGIDDALLCVIGMLEEMREVKNVPAWLRAGGLTRIPNSNASDSAADSAVGSVKLLAPTLDTLPSAEAFVHWHAVPEVRQYWLGRGKQALKRRNIELRHGIDPSSSGSQGGSTPLRMSVGSSATPSIEMRKTNEPASPDNRSAGKSRQSQEKGRRKGWSPSRPTSMSPLPDQAPTPDVYIDTEGVSTYDIAQDESKAELRHDDHKDLVSRSKQTPPSISTSNSISARPPSEDEKGKGKGKGKDKAKGETSSRYLEPIDTWRTFKACDIAYFLHDMSDRTSVPLTNEQRQVLSAAASVLAQFSADTISSNVQDLCLTKRDIRWAQMNLCVDCTLAVGERQGTRRNAQMKPLDRVGRAPATNKERDKEKKQSKRERREKEKEGKRERKIESEATWKDLCEGNRAEKRKVREMEDKPASQQPPCTRSRSVDIEANQTNPLSLKIIGSTNLNTRLLAVEDTMHGGGGGGLDSAPVSNDELDDTNARLLSSLQPQSADIACAGYPPRVVPHKQRRLYADHVALMEIPGCCEPDDQPSSANQLTQSERATRHRPERRPDEPLPRRDILARKHVAEYERKCETLERSVQALKQQSPLAASERMVTVVLGGIRELERWYNVINRGKQIPEVLDFLANTSGSLPGQDLVNNFAKSHPDFRLDEQAKYRPRALAKVCQLAVSGGRLLSQKRRLSVASTKSKGEVGEERSGEKEEKQRGEGDGETPKRRRVVLEELVIPPIQTARDTEVGVEWI